MGCTPCSNDTTKVHSCKSKNPTTDYGTNFEIASVVCKYGYVKDGID